MLTTDLCLVGSTIGENSIGDGKGAGRELSGRSNLLVTIDQLTGVIVFASRNGSSSSAPESCFLPVRFSGNLLKRMA